ncbi:hypothetical protein ACOMHN_031557 [Nucella lapillus]
MGEGSGADGRGRVVQIRRQWRLSKGGPDTDRYRLIRHAGKSTGKGLKGQGGSRKRAVAGFPSAVLWQRNGRFLRDSGG